MARIGGIPVRVHVTFLLVLPLLARSFRHGLVDASRLARITPGRIAGPPWPCGPGIAIGPFASLFVHDFAHPFVAIRQGGKVCSITLLVIGGVAELGVAELSGPSSFASRRLPLPRYT